MYNDNSLLRRLRWATVLIVVVASAFFLFLDSSGNLDNGLALIRNPFATIMGAVSSQTDSVADVLDGPRDLQTARAEIADLEAQVILLERENAQLKAAERELEQLRNLFDNARQSPENIRTVANVIGRDTSPAFQSLFIDKGINDGLAVGMPVESDEGLVGLILRTTANASQVILLTDTRSAVPGRLGESRAQGVIQGNGLSAPILMDWIALETQVEEDELVYTSGLAVTLPTGVTISRFPRDVIVGKVSTTQNSENGLFLQAVLQPAVNFDALEVVFVITDFETIDTTIFEEEEN